MVCARTRASLPSPATTGPSTTRTRWRRPTRSSPISTPSCWTARRSRRQRNHGPGARTSTPTPERRLPRPSGRQVRRRLPTLRRHRTNRMRCLELFARYAGGVFILVVATNPRHRARQIVLVAALGGAVKQLVCAVERVETAPVARVGVVDDAVVESERAQSGLLRADGSL